MVASLLVYLVTCIVFSVVCFFMYSSVCLFLALIDN